MNAPLARLAVVACALAAWPARALAQTAPERPQLDYVRRPFLLPQGQIVGRAGVGIASSSAPALVAGAQPTRALGGGVHAEFTFGLLRTLEASAGAGLRLGSDAETLAADRYARVDRDEVFQVGSYLVGNPYLRLRWAALDAPRSTVHLGVDAMIVAPLARATAWSLGVGVPVTLMFPSLRLRVDTGAFLQVIASGTAAVRNVFYVPVRVSVQVTPWLALGPVTAITGANVTLDSAVAPRVALGLQSAWRLGDGADLLVHWVFPAVQPLGFDAGGVGFSFVGRLR